VFKRWVKRPPYKTHSLKVQLLKSIHPTILPSHRSPTKRYSLWPQIYRAIRAVNSCTRLNVDSWLIYWILSAYTQLLFAIRFLKIPPHLQCVATLPCNLSLITKIYNTRFRLSQSLVFWQSYFISQGSVATRVMYGGFLTTTLLQIFYWACIWKKTLKIGQYFVKLQQEHGVFLFMGLSVLHLYIT